MGLEKKSLIFGLGTGTILASLLFYTVYSFEYKDQNLLGLSNNGANITDEEIIERAMKLGMISLKEAAERPSEPGEANKPLSDEEIIERAKSLGMAFKMEIPVTTNLTNANTDTDLGQNATSRENQIYPKYVLVRITAGSNASSVARLLEEKGVVDSAEAFRSFMIAQRATQSILVGTFNLPLNGSYEEVLAIILDRNQRIQ